MDENKLFLFDEVDEDPNKPKIEGDVDEDEEDDKKDEDDDEEDDEEEEVV